MVKEKAPEGMREISPASLAEIMELARQQIHAEQVVADIENSLRDAKDILERIQMEDLPDAMNELGVKKFTLDTGETVELKHDFDVGILVENRPTAFSWLEKNNFGGLVKTTLVVEFGKGEYQRALDLQAKLAKAKGVTVLVNRDIHWQTLKAFVKEQDAAKRKLPDIFGAHPHDKTKITVPKATR